jgi:predicted dienelactone hydrolase
MRSLEIITVILLLTAWASRIIPIKRYHPMRVWTVGLALCAGILQWAVEGYRWSMVPAYLLAGLLFILAAAELRTGEPDRPASFGTRILNVIGVILGSAAVAFAAGLPLLFPVFSLPEPSGPYAVGATVFEWIDESRPETFTSDPGDRRDLLVRVWYPAEKPVGAEPIPLWPDAALLGPQVAGTFGLPAFLFDQLALVPSHAYPDAPPASAALEFPVLIFSHAYVPGYAGQNTVQMEELASYGYVVFAIAHPLEAAAVVYPDGRATPYSRERYRDVIREGTLPAIPILKEFVAATDPAEQERLFRLYLEANPAALESAKIWTEDTLFVMDQVERLNRGEVAGPFAGHLDLNRMGIFGHSMGGVVAGEVCSRDVRCKAGVNLDGVQLGDLFDGRLEIPFMMMYSSINAGQNDFIFDRMDNTYYRVEVAGTVHTDFCDFPLFSPLFAAVGAAGFLPPERMEHVLNSYLLAFFDKHLRGVDSPLLHGTSPDFPEVSIRFRNAQG